MTLIGFLTVAALFSALANALSISHGALARHHHIARAEHEADLVEKRVGSAEFSSEVEKRGNGKIGLAWAQNDASNIPHFVNSKTQYLYTWSPYCPPEALQHNLHCCPMLWGTKDISQFEQQLHEGSKCAMGMNEVNVPSQGKLSVAAGIRLWNKYIRPLADKGYYLVSPSVTSGNDGLAWLKQFFEQCGGPGSHCQANALAQHYYGTKVSDFIDWANKFHAIFPGDIWVTEIACQNFGGGGGQCSPAEVIAFMDGTIAWMEKTSWIKAYFFFGLFWDMYNVNPDNRMVNKDGLPNNLGYHYLGGA